MDITLHDILATTPDELEQQLRFCPALRSWEGGDRIAGQIQERETLASMSDVTQVLERVSQGDSHASEELLPLVYDELRKLAAHRMAHEIPGHTLQPTALVHEAWLRLIGSESVRWNGRGHFFGAAPSSLAGANRCEEC